MKLYILLIQATGAYISIKNGHDLTSHKGPTLAWEDQVLSHLYVCNNQFDITYHVLFNKYIRPKLINTSEYGWKFVVHFS